jgi:hypothetical protein
MGKETFLMKIELVQCNNGLGARLSIRDFTPEAWKSQYEEIESLHLLLSQAGIVQEFLDKPSLQMAHDLLNKAQEGITADILEEVQSMVVASGVPPMDNEIIGLRLLKAYLMAEEELNNLKSRLARESYESIARSINPGCVVEKGAMILGFTAIKKGNPGVGVFGEKIQPNPYGSSLPRPGGSILEEDNKWIALKRGILVVEDNTFKILGPRSQDDNCILVSQDKMSVRLILHKDDEDDFKPTLGFIQQFIADQHFALPPAMDKVRSAFEAFDTTGKNQDLVILSGKPSSPGKNGSLELIVQLSPDLPAPSKKAPRSQRSFHPIPVAWGWTCSAIRSCPMR